MKIIDPRFELNIDYFGVKTGMDGVRSAKIRSNLLLDLGVKYWSLVESNSIKLIDYLDYITVHDISQVHSDRMIDLIVNNPKKLLSLAYSQPESDFDAPEAFVDMIIKAASSVYKAMDLSLRDKENYFLLQCYAGAHHARINKSNGFCVINDVAVSLSKLKNEKKINKVLIFDVDAHKGDGNSEIFYNKDFVKTFSIHIDGWPLNDRSLEDYPSTVDVKLPFNCDGKTYLKCLDNGMSALEKNISMEEIDLVVVLAGSDPWEYDMIVNNPMIPKEKRLLYMTEAELLDRDLRIYDFFKSKSIPQTWLMSGGYGPNSYKIPLNFLKKNIKFER